MGRFISPDTIIPHPANPQSFNRYSYCLNNPLKYRDPNGLCTEPSSTYPIIANLPYIPGTGLLQDTLYRSNHAYFLFKVQDVIKIPFDVIVTADASWQVLRSPYDDYNLYIQYFGWLAESPLSLFAGFFYKPPRNRGQVAKVRVYGEVTIRDYPGWPLIIEINITIEGEGIKIARPIFHGFERNILNEYVVPFILKGGKGGIFVDRNITPWYIEIRFRFTIPGYYDVVLSRDSLIIDLTN